MKKFRSLSDIYTSGETYKRTQQHKYNPSNNHKNLTEAYKLIRENVETNILAPEVIEEITGVKSITVGTITENPIINYYSYLIQEGKLDFVLNNVKLSAGTPIYRAVLPELNGKGYNVLSKYMTEMVPKKDEPFKITTAGIVKKLRTPSGGRVCQWEGIAGDKILAILNDPSSYEVEKIRNQNLFRVICIVHLMHQFTGNLAQVSKMPAGISYEIDQIDTFNENLSDLPDLGFILPQSNDLYRDSDKDVVLINGAANVEGVPKADMSLTLNEKDVFWISYKHGEYVEEVTKPGDIPFQQYGSPGGIYGDKDLKPIVDNFLTKVSNKIGNYYTRDQIIAVGEKNPNAEKGSMELIMNHYGKHLAKKKKDGSPANNIWNKNKVEDFYIYPSGTAEHAAKLFDSERKPLGSELELLALKSIYGDDYTGKDSDEFGINNVNILLQTPESAKFTIMKDEQGFDPDEAVAVRMTLVDKSHVIFNPNLPDSLPYLPCMYIRHTVGNFFIFNNERTGKVSAILGGRLLVYPQGSASSTAVFVDLFE